MEFRQPKRWIGEKQGTVASINKIIGRVEPFTFPFIRQHGSDAVSLDAHHTPITTLANSEPALLICSQAIRAGLPILFDIFTRITGLRAINLHVTVRRHPKDSIIVWIAE